MFDQSRLPAEFSAGALDRVSLLQYLERTPPLLDGLRDPAAQIQPNGIDLTVLSIARLVGPGRIGVRNDERKLPAPALLEPDRGWYRLDPGLYLITLNEIVHLPLNLMALAWPRSSLLRSGVTVHTAVWDAGYHGRSEVLLAVQNPEGFHLKRDARIVQLVVFSLARPVDQGYQGRYQGENLTDLRST